MVPGEITTMLIWIGIVLCLTQSAMMSGLNLAFFSLSRLRLEAEAGVGSKAAVTILAMRRDSNFLLTTILWGNVGINVLLTLLSNSILAGVAAFVFSTVVITFAGEILPQAFFSRRAMKMAALFAPVLRVYQFALYPVAKPSAWILDQWLGVERVEFLRERQLKGVIEQHIESDSAEIDFIEGRGALNFLDIDEVPISDEGEYVDPASVITLPTTIDLPVLPRMGRSAADPFIQRVSASGKKWVVLVDTVGRPQLVMDSDAYLRAALIGSGDDDGYAYCHRPIIIENPNRPLGSVILDLRRGMEETSDEALVRDIVLLWTESVKKVVTGADLLGRLLRGMS
jgi:metal transporter CNNM